jgi:hypothetical protein
MRVRRGYFPRRRQLVLSPPSLSPSACKVAGMPYSPNQEKTPGVTCTMPAISQAAEVALSRPSSRIWGSGTERQLLCSHATGSHANAMHATCTTRTQPVQKRTFSAEHDARHSTTWPVTQLDIADLDALWSSEKAMLGCFGQSFPLRARI